MAIEGGTVPEEPTQESRAAARVGTVVRGKYRLDALLGVGGMASVYAATHRNKKRFAVKLLHAELSMNEDVRTRFLREGYVANTVEHPGAVEVLDEDVAEDGAAFLVMELLEGQTLDAIAASGKMPLRSVLALAHQLLDVLAAAHAKRVVHRDIKPGNVFLTKDGSVKVLDFGIARLRDAGGSQTLRAHDSGGHAAHATTGIGVALGTPGFMAAEQALGRADEIDGRTDVWAVGATMFTLLTGKTVHEARSGQEIMIAAATKPARGLASVAPEVSPVVAAVVDKALALAREDRWQSAVEMRAAVGDAYQRIFDTAVSSEALSSIVARVQVPSLSSLGDKSDPLGPTVAAPASPGAKPPTSLVATAAPLAGKGGRERTVAIAVGGIALVAALGVWLATRGGPPPTPATVPSPSATAGLASASASVTAAAITAAPTTPAETATASAAASVTASASAPSAPRRPAATRAPAASPKPQPPHDSFDHQ